MSDKSRFSVLIESSPPPVSNRANKQPASQPMQPSQSTSQPMQPNNIFKKPVTVTAKTNMPPAMNTNNFPELCSQTSEKSSNINFKQIFDQPEMTTTAVDDDLVNLPEGWTLLKRDPSNGKTIMKGKGLQERNKHTPYTPDKPVEKSENQLYNELFQSIVETNQKRTNEFIELNDYDVWHAMYQFSTSNHFEDVEEDSDSETESDCTYDDVDEDYDYY